MPVVDDAVLRAAAADLIASARREVPATGLALQAVEHGLGTLAVEHAALEAWGWPASDTRTA